MNVESIVDVNRDWLRTGILRFLESEVLKPFIDQGTVDILRRHS